MEGGSWLSLGHSCQSEAASKPATTVNGFSLMQDLGTFPGKLVPAACLDHPCDVGGEDEVSQICNQAVQRSEILHVI